MRYFVHGLLGFWVVCCASPCNADLFATLARDGMLLRIDTNTGDVLRHYSSPPDPDFTSSPAGVAYDGDLVYVGRSTPDGLARVWPFDPVEKDWLPSLELDPITVHGGTIARLDGMGVYTDGDGLRHLLAVSRSPQEIPTSTFFDYDLSLAPGMLHWSAAPVELPIDFVALGMDVDPATGEIWVSGGLTPSVLGNPALIRVDPFGAEIDRLLLPELAGATLRGLAFDDGRMFVGIRNAVASANQIVEVDRNSGEILNTFTLPSEFEGILTGLTGGAVVPEPATWAIAFTAIAGLWVRASSVRSRGRHRP